MSGWREAQGRKAAAGSNASAIGRSDRGEAMHGGPSGFIGWELGINELNVGQIRF
jgi:hypothetical protein